MKPSRGKPAHVRLSQAPCSVPLELVHSTCDEKPPLTPQRLATDFEAWLGTVPGSQVTVDKYLTEFEPFFGVCQIHSMQAERLRTGQQSLVSTLVETAAIAQKAKSALSSAASASSVFRSYVVVQSKPRGSSSWSHSDVYRDESGSGGFTEANRALVELSRASGFTGH